MIFAAGLGTRLRPFTFNKPKALLEINQTPLLEICIKNLIHYGFNDIIINVHHFADQILEFLKSKNNFGANITISDETDLLLETGGGLMHAIEFLNEEPFLVHNVDIISDINLLELYKYHLEQNSIATLAVMKRISSRYLYFTDSNELMGWTNMKTNEKIITRNNSEYQQFAFTGIHVISPEIFDLIDNQGSFSIIPEYLNISKTKKISAIDCTKNKWVDVGKPENIQFAEEIHTQLVY